MKDIYEKNLSIEKAGEKQSELKAESKNTGHGKVPNGKKTFYIKNAGLLNESKNGKE